LELNISLKIKKALALSKSNEKVTKRKINSVKKSKNKINLLTQIEIISKTGGKVKNKKVVILKEQIIDRKDKEGNKTKRRKEKIAITYIKGKIKRISPLTGTKRKTKAYSRERQTVLISTTRKHQI
jgi:hypothetical protein